MAAEGPAVVADASVVAKWFLAEKEREAALHLRDDFVAGSVSLASPALMPFEVMNAVRFSKKSIGTPKLKAMGRSLSLYAVELHPLKDEYLDLTMEASDRNGITVYDGSYVALARKLDSVLYTADRALLHDLRKSDRKYARHIEEYGKAARERRGLVEEGRR